MAAETFMYMVGLLVVLVLLGFHIAVALAMTSVLGIYLMMGSFDVAVSLLGSAAYEAVRSQTYIVIPLFILMGDFVSKSGTAGDLYQLCNRGLRRVSGRLAVATVAGNTVFSAVTGVSVAAAAAFSRIAYPEMRRLGYQKEYAVGVVAGSACLGMLLPPSLLLIVWAILTEASVGRLFLAGVIPGLILAVFFAVYCIVYARLYPHVAPEPETGVELPPLTRSQVLGGVGVLLLIVLVIGGLWGGLFTPTEAAAFGTVGALVLGIAKGMRGRQVMQAIYSAGRTTGPIMILLIAATMYSRLMAMSGAVNYIQSLFLDMGSVFLVLGLITVIWILLGLLIDSVSIILLTVPIFVPIAMTLGLDPTAFAIFGILVIEAGLLTPPFGLVVFAVKGAVPDRDIKLKHVFKGAFPYCILLLVCAFLILSVPQLATWLPDVAFG